MAFIQSDNLALRGYDAAACVRKIVDGRLYSNDSKRVQRKWEANIPEFIRQAQANWPAVSAK